jgi:hypothetical protein
VETTREIVKGYTVVYRYNGRDITTTLPYNPGKTVKVGIGVVDDGHGSVPATASTMGSNVREIGANDTASTAATAGGGAPAGHNFSYRY